MTNEKQYQVQTTVLKDMRKYLLCFTLLASFCAIAQPEKPKNYRRFDDRVLHFGFMLGINSSNFSAYPKLNAYEDYGLTAFETKAQPGGQVGIVGHITIGDNVRIQAQSGVGKSVKDGETLQGSPSFNYGDWNKSYVHFRNLPKIVADLENLKKKTN